MEYLKIDTEFCTDSVEFCPISPHTNLVCVGTYQVLTDQNSKSNETAESLAAGHQSEQATSLSGTAAETKRTGRLLLYNIEYGDKSFQKHETSTIDDMADTEKTTKTIIHCTEKQRIETGAILDIKW
jgi:hypothetical protein